MSTITEQQVREHLSRIKYPGFSRDIVSFGIIKEIRIDGADVTVQMALATDRCQCPAADQAGERGRARRDSRHRQIPCKH